VVAQVVVGHARVRVDELRGAVRVRGVDLGGDQHRGVAEGARVEDRRDLADDALVEQVADAFEHLPFREPGELGDRGERARVEREAALHQIEQLLVGLVQRDGGAALARPDLGPRYVSHRATSFA
jgi:hypothetical protein